MKNKICMLIMSLVIIFSVFSVVIADDKLENYKMTDYDKKYGFFHAIMYGTSIDFVEGTGTASTSDTKIINIEGNQLKALQP